MAVLGHVCATFKRDYIPGRSVETKFALAQPVKCDRGRVAQLLSNLLGSGADVPCARPSGLLGAVSDANFFELSVSNPENPIRAGDPDRLLQPFSEAVRAAPSRQAFGLGFVSPAQ